MIRSTHFVEGTNIHGKTLYYTGRAGDGWVSPRREDAFVGWVESGAQRKAETLNRFSSLHGITFRPAAVEN